MLARNVKGIGLHIGSLISRLAVVKNVTVFRLEDDVLTTGIDNAEHDCTTSFDRSGAGNFRVGKIEFAIADLLEIKSTISGGHLQFFDCDFEFVRTRADAVCRQVQVLGGDIRRIAIGV